MALDFSHIKQRIEQPAKSKPTWEGVEVVEYLQIYIDIPEKGNYGKTFHYRKLKELKMTLDQAKRVIDIMLARAKWVSDTTGEQMHRGKWITNRYKEMAEIGVDRFIAKNSR